MADGDGGLVWKLQLVVFVVVALDAGRRVAGGLTLDTSGVLDLALLCLSLAGAVYVAWTRQPVSAAFGGGEPSDGPGDDAAGEETDPAPEES